VYSENRQLFRDRLCIKAGKGREDRNKDSRRGPDEYSHRLRRYYHRFTKSARGKYKKDEFLSSDVETR
jgi:hypothetical protein